MLCLALTLSGCFFKPSPVDSTPPDSARGGPDDAPSGSDAQPPPLDPCFGSPVPLGVNASAWKKPSLSTNGLVMFYSIGSGANDNVMHWIARPSRSASFTDPSNVDGILETMPGTDLFVWYDSGVQTIGTVDISGNGRIDTWELDDLGAPLSNPGHGPTGIRDPAANSDATYYAGIQADGRLGIYLGSNASAMAISIATPGTGEQFAAVTWGNNDQTLIFVTETLAGSSDELTRLDYNAVNQVPIGTPRSLGVPRQPNDVDLAPMLTGTPATGFELYWVRNGELMLATCPML